MFFNVQSHKIFNCETDFTSLGDTDKGGSRPLKIRICRRRCVRQPMKIPGTCQELYENLCTSVPQHIAVTIVCNIEWRLHTNSHCCSFQVYKCKSVAYLPVNNEKRKRVRNVTEALALCACALFHISRIVPTAQLIMSRFCINLSSLSFSYIKKIIYATNACLACLIFVPSSKCVPSTEKIKQDQDMPSALSIACSLTKPIKPQFTFNNGVRSDRKAQLSLSRFSGALKYSILGGLQK